MCCCCIQQHCSKNISSDAVCSHPEIARGPAAQNSTCQRGFGVCVGVAFNRDCVCAHVRARTRTRTDTHPHPHPHPLWHPKIPEHPLSGVGVVPTMTPRVGQLVSRLLRNLIQMGGDEQDCRMKTAQGELKNGTLPMSTLIGTATCGATLTLMPSIFFRNL